MSKILIVDDEIQVAHQIKELLKNYGHKAGFIPRGEFLFKRLEAEMFDLILLDIHMPGTDGITLLEELKQHPKLCEIPVIMMTAEMDESLIGRSFEKGANDFLQKPLSEMVMKARVENALTIRREQVNSQRLLENVLPKQIAEELKLHGRSEPRFIGCCTVVFVDFCGFTRIAARWEPTQLVNVLGKYFGYFDLVMETYQLEKLKTLGDGYMFAGGLPTENDTHALECVMAALEIKKFMKILDDFSEYQQEGEGWQLRIGMHSGPVVAGVIGEKKFAYDIWGDTVNTASRMETIGVKDEINISKSTWEFVKDIFECEARGHVEVKGKGLMETFLVKGFLPKYSVSGNQYVPNEDFYKMYYKRKGKEYKGVEVIRS